MASQLPVTSPPMKTGLTRSDKVAAHQFAGFAAQAVAFLERVSRFHQHQRRSPQSAWSSERSVWTLMGWKGR